MYSMNFQLHLKIQTEVENVPKKMKKKSRTWFIDKDMKYYRSPVDE